MYSIFALMHENVRINTRYDGCTCYANFGVIFELYQISLEICLAFLKKFWRTYFVTYAMV